MLISRDIILSMMLFVLTGPLLQACYLGLSMGLTVLCLLSSSLRTANEA
jgi:hypothetical protein